MGLFDRAVDGVIRFGQGLATRMLNTPPPTANTPRAKALGRLEALYWGKQYEGQGLSTPWDKIRRGEQRRPLAEQRPSVQYDIARSIVDRPTALLFGEGRFPSITIEPAKQAADGSDETVADVNAWLSSIADEGGLDSVALTWSRQGGALGSAVLTWCVVEGEFEFEAHKSSHCTPTFHPRKRTKLVALEKKYIFRKTEESVDPITQVRTTREVDYWHRETWDEKTHTVFKDAKAENSKEPTWIVDDVATHGFGFCPAVWVKNLDDGDPASIDGVSLIEGLDDIFEDIDRTLSQKSRAVRYNQDPERVYYGLSEKDRQNLELIRVGGGASTALGKKTEGAGAELLELQGEGQKIAEEHVVGQRGRALEVSRVVMPDPERLLAASKSGAALRILFAPTLELVGELRKSYGRAMRMVFEQILRAARERRLAVLGKLLTPPPANIPAGKVKLQWGAFFDATPEDFSAIATAAATLKASGVLDTETLVRWIASHFGIKDVQAVIDRIEDERNSEYGPLPNVNGGRLGTSGNMPPEKSGKPGANVKNEPAEPADNGDG